ncbi:hypothetical protein PAAG_05982 [Paracoccidioides lutzii Pb01]|uniref:Uncharacterized protein n=1 Tax=Paracoccidioides lutzii (strain ATCC MYA-826 / Pb01) TaxID=502779 RepID=C1H5E1_PARBA|nr:hypothetical protein PAAG_05982 [Paracoccidioides lutzii Pb01]EEH34935.2 hypothetical protein PAAG_05982 [Paracoccidioides lutzii Pb01]
MSDYIVEACWQRTRTRGCLGKYQPALQLDRYPSQVVHARVAIGISFFQLFPAPSLIPRPIKRPLDPAGYRYNNHSSVYEDQIVTHPASGTFTPSGIQSEREVHSPLRSCHYICNPPSAGCPSCFARECFASTMYGGGLIYAVYALAGFHDESEPATLDVID